VINPTNAKNVCDHSHEAIICELTPGPIRGKNHTNADTAPKHSQEAMRGKDTKKTHERVKGNKRKQQDSCKMKNISKMNTINYFPQEFSPVASSSQYCPQTTA